MSALHRGLEILRCFRPSDGPLGNQDLARRSGLPKPTVSRLTYTLSKLGYLVYLSDEGKYRVGVPVLGLGYACLGGTQIREAIQPHMQMLADDVGDGALVTLAGRDDLSMIYIACARSVGVISLQLNVGSRISLGRSGLGRAYLAAVSDDEREALLARMRARAGENWSGIEVGIRRSRREIQKQGFCVNVGDWHPHVNGVAVPLRLSRLALPVLALNCGAPSYVLSPERARALGPRLLAITQKVLSQASSL